MPRTREISTGTMTERWTIVSHTVVAPTLPGTADGSLEITFVKETLVGDVVKLREPSGSTVSGPEFHAVWADAGARVAAAIAAGAAPKDALYVGMRDAQYAYLQRQGGPIPSEAN